MTQGSSVPPGWYPQAGGVERYWDGREWTLDTRALQSEPPSGGAMAPAYREMPYGGGSHPAPYPMAQPGVRVSPKSPGIAILGSFFLPGLGQFINGDVLKGVAFLVAFLISVPLVLLLIGLITTPVIWIVSMVDAYQSAQRWNARHGIIS